MKLVRPTKYKKRDPNDQMSKAYIEQAKREKEEEERRRAAAQKTKDWYDRNGPRYQRSVEESFARNRAYGEAQREKKRQLSSLAPTLGGQQKQLRRALSGSLVKAPNPLVTQFGIRRYDEQQVPFAEVAGAVK